ncbi:MAG: ATP-dependent DNA ligase, partial [Planctomycetota bacterium]
LLWSRGEELVHDQFPEVRDALAALPDGTVLDGEVLAWKEGHALPFADLQRRLGRKRVSKKLLADVPLRFVAFDVLELEGVNVRSRPLADRRRKLERLLADAKSETLGVSQLVVADGWAALAEERNGSRDRRVEGVMLKRADSPYGVGRPMGWGGSGRSIRIPATPC